MRCYLVTLFFVVLTANIAQASECKLLPDECNTIEVFERTSTSVVYIESLAVRRRIFSMDVFEVPQGTGSGFIWDKKGHVVTNFHVIQGSSSFKVTLHNQKSFDAKLVGFEESKDLAVLKIEPQGLNLAPVVQGDSGKIRVGQKILSIGNPFGLDNTLTTGVVSALGREIKARNERTIKNVIQMDAAINPGNSGGPLLDSMGQVIGVNTAIISPSGVSAGIGFAVPMNTVKRVVPQLIKYGKVIRPGLGVEVVSDAVAMRYGIKGVIIAKVFQNTSAKRKGLKGLSLNRNGEVRFGDVIIGIGGQKVVSADQFGHILENYKVGERVPIKVSRDGVEREIQITLVQLN
jgi:S1-C subfamily serine protease